MQSARLLRQDELLAVGSRASEWAAFAIGLTLLWYCLIPVRAIPLVFTYNLQGDEVAGFVMQTDEEPIIRFTNMSGRVLHVAGSGRVNPDIFMRYSKQGDLNVRARLIGNGRHWIRLNPGESVEDRWFREGALASISFGIEVYGEENKVIFTDGVAMTISELRTFSASDGKSVEYLR